MTTTFEDNTEVTLADLNNIGVDLGDTDFNAFSTEKFGVDKLNQITSDLVSSGVLRTGENGELGCEVIASNNMAYIQPGVIVFESGAKIRITDLVEVALLPGTVIYALNNPTTGRASIDVSEVLPDGDCVWLARVNADGTLADMRSSCVAKVMMTADQRNVYKEIEVKKYVNTYQDPASNIFTVNIGTDAYSYIMVHSVRIENSTSPAISNYAFLSQDEVENVVSTRNSTYAIFKRSGPYQEIRVGQTGFQNVSGTFTIKFIVM